MRFSLIMSFIVVFSLVSQAVDYYWVGGTNTFWSTATNWSPVGVPGAADRAYITSGNPTIELSNTVTVGGLVQNTGAISVLGNNLIVTGTVSATGGRIADFAFVNSPGRFITNGVNQSVTLRDYRISITADIAGSAISIEDCIVNAGLTVTVNGSSNGTARIQGSNFSEDVSIINLNSSTTYINENGNLNSFSKTLFLDNRSTKNIDLYGGQSNMVIDYDISVVASSGTIRLYGDRYGDYRMELAPGSSLTEGAANMANSRLHLRNVDAKIPLNLDIHAFEFFKCYFFQPINMITTSTAFQCISSRSIYYENASFISNNQNGQDLYLSGSPFFPDVFHKDLFAQNNGGAGSIMRLGNTQNNGDTTYLYGNLTVAQTTNTSTTIGKCVFAQNANVVSDGNTNLAGRFSIFGSRFGGTCKINATDAAIRSSVFSEPAYFSFEAPDNEFPYVQDCVFSDSATFVNKSVEDLRISRKAFGVESSECTFNGKVILDNQSNQSSIALNDDTTYFNNDVYFKNTGEGITVIAQTFLNPSAQIISNRGDFNTGLLDLSNITKAEVGSVHYLELGGTSTLEFGNMSDFLGRIYVEAPNILNKTSDLPVNLYFTGSLDQNLTSTSSTMDAQKFEVDKPSGKLVVDKILEVNDLLYFRNGIVEITAGNRLDIKTNLCLGGSVTAHINGAVRVYGDPSRNVPMGNGVDRYFKVLVQSTTNYGSGLYFDLSFHVGDPTDGGYDRTQKDSPSYDVTDCQYLIFGMPFGYGRNFKLGIDQAICSANPQYKRGVRWSSGEWKSNSTSTDSYNSATQSAVVNVGFVTSGNAFTYASFDPPTTTVNDGFFLMF